MRKPPPFLLIVRFLVLISNGKKVAVFGVDVDYMIYTKPLGLAFEMMSHDTLTHDTL